MVKICVVCGKEFKGRNCSKCCSAECQDELYRRNQKKYRKKRKPKSERPIDQINTGQRNTLCWSCQNATGRCSWSARLEPVEGWKAEELEVKGNFYTGSIVQSYIVRKCPKYIKDS